MKKYIFSLLLLLPLVGLHAETEEHILNNRHEVRIGLGESFMGHMLQFGCIVDEPIWGDFFNYNHSSVEEVHNYLSQDHYIRYNEVNFAPHVFAEYIYRFNRWFGLGAQTDFYTHSNLMRTRNGYGDLGRQHYESGLCWSVVGVARFTYYRSEWVSMYSHISLGVSTAFGMTDSKVDYTEVLPAFGATLYGISVGKDHWFGTFELGCFNTAANFLFMERMFSLSAGYRF